MRASIINSIKFQLCAALGSDAAGITVWTKNVARLGFKQVLKFLPVTDHDFYYMYVNYFTENKRKINKIKQWLPVRQHYRWRT